MAEPLRRALVGLVLEAVYAAAFADAILAGALLAAVALAPMLGVGLVALAEATREAFRARR